MSDARLRDLQRIATASGSPSDEARVLTERLRQGSLTRERLELAAYVGHEAARVTSGFYCTCGHAWSAHDDAARPPHRHLGCLYGWGRGDGCRCKGVPPPGVAFTGDPLQGAQPLDEWVAGLRRFADCGPCPGWVLVKAAVAAARVALDALECSACGGSGSDDPLTAEFPCGWCRGTGAEPELEFTRPSLVPARIAVAAVEAWLEHPDRGQWEARHVAYVEAGHLAWLPAPGNERALEAIPRAAHLTGDAPVRTAITHELSRWALS